MENVDQLLLKLDAFIKKYYKNRLIKGLIYCVSMLLIFFIVLALTEYFAQFNIAGRSFLFYSYLVFAASVTVYYVFIPLFKLYKIGEVISYEEAANIVGNHFKSIKDRLLNTLQLAQTQHSVPQEQLALLKASIDQRISQMEPVPFNAAIDFKENTKYLKYLFIPFLIFGAIAFYNFNIFSSSAERILNHSKEIIPTAPFTFSLETNNLTVLTQENLPIKLSINGDYIPSKAYIVLDGKKQKLTQTSATEFNYTIRSIEADKSFQFYADGYTSKTYTIKTIPNPSLVNFSIQLTYPKHTSIPNKILENTGDFTIPEGTKVQWQLNTKNTNKVSFRFPDSTLNIAQNNSQQYQLDRSFFNNSNYTLITANEHTVGKDSIAYYISVIKDQRPQISIEETKDSNNTFVSYFNGDVIDDYGFSKLEFSYKILKEGEKSKTISTPISVNKKFNKDNFFHFFDFTTINIEPNTKIEYYFTVWDNDKINGYKSTRSQTQVLDIPSVEDLADRSDEQKEEIKKDLDDTFKDAKNLKKELKEIQQKLLEKAKPDWQDKNRIQQLLDHQQNLQQQFDQIKQQNEQNNFEQNQLTEQEQEILEKQQLLEQMFEELMSEEMKQMYEELQKLMEEMNKDKLLDKLDDIEMNNEEVLKNLDRSIEQFKQLEFEEKLDNVTDRLEELAKQQEELAKQTENKEKSAFELHKEQEKLNDAFEKVQEEMKELEKLNEDLENKHDLDDTKEDQKSIDEDQKESQEQLNNKKNKKAAKAQKSAADKMNSLAQKMSNMKASEQAAKAEEDIQALKQLLENLVTFSFDQEQLMQTMKSTPAKDPKYVDLGQQQQKLKNDAQLLEDSLFALSKRIIQLQSFIHKEVTQMNASIDDALDYIGERKTGAANSKQQYTMTAANNLAVMLDEVMQQLQAQQKSKTPGSGSCSKPGGSGSPSPGDMKGLKKKMEDQLQKMKDAMSKGGKKPGQKPGKQPGGEKGNSGKPGDKGSSGNSGTPNSKQFAKMAAEQREIRRQMEQISQKMNEDGSGKGNALKQLAKELEEIENNLMNKKIDSKLIERQKEINIRMLEIEKAEKEQGIDKKRKSNESKNQKYSNPTQYLEYKRKKEKEIELLKTIPPSLKPYYKNKVNEYFEKIGE